MDLYAGQVGVVRHGTSWVARGISWVTRSPAFHVVVGVGDGNCIGAEPGGARVRPVDYWTGAVWSRFEMSAKQADLVARFALQHEGAPYAFFDDALIGLRYTAGLKAPDWLLRHLSADRQWMCSELADASLMAGGINLWPGRWACDVAPGDFLDEWVRRGWVEDAMALAEV